MAYAGELPWHGLGNRVDHCVSPDEMLVAAGLDWEILRTRIFAEMPDGSKVRIPDRRAMIRSSDSKFMTIASHNWKPLQNRDLMEFFRDYAEAGGAKLETAGSLRGGSVVWGLANLNDGFNVGGNDRVNGYLLFTSPHKVGSAITIRTTTVRVVCANTMALAERSGRVDYSQSHMKTFDVTGAKAAIERAHEGLALAAKRAETLKGIRLSVSDRLAFLGKFFDVPAGATAEEITAIAGDEKTKLHKVLSSIENAPGADPDTAWGVLNGVTHWGDHVNGREAASRMFRSWMGDVAEVKLEVEKGLLELA